MSRKLLLAFAAALASAASAAASQSVAPFPLSVSHVGLRVRVDFTKGTVSGAETLTVENTSTGAVSAVPLNLNRLMQYAGASDSAGALKLAQEIHTFEDRPRLQVNHATVALRSPLPPHEKTTIAVEYAGYLAPYTETGSLYIRDTVDEAFTILRRDAYAYPAVESLSTLVNRASPQPSFGFEAHVTVPSTHTVATGGRLIDSHSDNGETTFHFRSVHPVPFLNIAIARYKTIDRNGARIYYFPEDEAGAVRIAEKTDAAMQLLTSWFGPLTDAPEFTIIEIPDGWGSQANLNGGVIQSASAFRNVGSMPELYHELSHFWNVPDSDAPSPRWNEGLATYLQRRIAGEVDHTDVTADDARRIAARLVKMAAKEPRLATVPFSQYGREQMTDYAYGVGFIMFYGLENRIGREALLRCYRQYYQQFKKRGASFNELMVTVAEVSGQDLTPFFADWVTTTRWLTRLEHGEAVERIGSAAATTEHP